MAKKIRNLPLRGGVQYLCGLAFSLTAFFGASAQAAVCTYSINNEWNNGFQGAITITNNGTTAISGWSVGWQYTANKLTSSWNATITGSNPYTAVNVGWNKIIQPGQSVSFGVQGEKNGGAAEKPTVTGAVCSAVTSSSSVASSSSKSSVSSVASSVSSVVSSVSSSKSSVASSSTSSNCATTSRCNWYGNFYPSCVTTTSGWGYENGKSCIANSTCATQPAPFGVVAGCGVSSSSVVSSSSSIKSSSSVVSNSSSVKSSSSVVSSSSSIKSSSSVVSSSSSSKLSSSSVSSSIKSSSSSASSIGVASLKALASFPIGVAVNAGNENNSIISSGTAAQQQAVVFPHFNQLTAGNIMKMSYMHPSENTYNFTNADALINFAVSNGFTVHAHTLIWHSDYQVPSFMKNYTGDFAAMLKTHVQTVAAHFAGKVKSWDVVNEALAESGDSSAVNGFRNSLFFQKMGADYIDQAFINARAVDPSAELYYNDYNIENGGTKTTYLLALVDGMKTRGVPIDGVGFQMHVLSDWPSTSTIEAAFKAVADRGLKVKITELDVRVNNPYNSSAPVYTSLTSEAAAKQKERYRQIVASYLKVVPAAQRGGITVWGVWDTDSWLNTSSAPDWPLLFDANFAPKPALQGFADGLTGN
ncbi:MAG: endo-1,4-beta-xylanase [Cellvibrio sp.]